MPGVRGAGKLAVGKVGGFFEDFRKFIDRGNVVDLAVGVILGAAFGAVVASLVGDIFSPILGLLGTASLQDLFVVMRYGKDVPEPYNVTYPTVAKAKEAGAITLNYGNFVQTVINFLMVAFCLFIFIKLLFVFKKKQAAAAPSTDWPCPKCKVKNDNAGKHPNSSEKIRIFFLKNPKKIQNFFFKNPKKKLKKNPKKIRKKIWKKFEKIQKKIQFFENNGGFLFESRTPS